MWSLTATVMLSFLTAPRTTSAMPTLYCWLSSITAIVLALRCPAMYFSAAAPCAAFLPMMRWKYLKLWVDSESSVADGEMLTTCACSRMGSAVLDSPEKAGPTMATVLSLITLLARVEAWVGSPWLSYSLSTTFGPVPLALNWSMASFTPLLMLIPSWAFAPVRAPKKPTLTDWPLPDVPVLPAAVVVVVLDELLHAATT